MLLDPRGQPLFKTTIYVLTELRARNRAVNSIRNTLQAIIAFHLFLEKYQIDLEERLSIGGSLTVNEVDELARFLRFPLRDQYISPESVEVKKVDSVSLEKYRKRMGTTHQDQISTEVAATRMRYVRDYVTWLTLEYMSRTENQIDLRNALDSTNKIVRGWIDSRLPLTGSSTLIGSREGVEASVIDRMFQVTDPRNADNPWRDTLSKYRNHLILHWLNSLGLRRGELLSVRIPNIDFRKGTVVIHRSPDDPDDPRDNQPLVKTRGREIPMSPDLLDMTQSYILEYRSGTPNGRKHDFLFVARNGMPLSISSLAKVFNTLKIKYPEFPDNFSPHVLRHTWNDRFSEEMEARNVGEEEEKKLRSYLMGWSDTSEQAATYTKRYVRLKAQKVSLAMQEKMFDRETDE